MIDEPLTPENVAETIENIQALHTRALRRIGLMHAVCDAAHSYREASSDVAWETLCTALDALEADKSVLG